MSSSHYLRPLLQAPASCRVLLLPPARPQARSFALLAPLPHSRFLSLPRIIQPSFWASLVPKPFKSRPGPDQSLGWNPATPYIILGLLVGSQAIQILWLKQERSHDYRKAEAKIGVLKEVIERVQRGEVVPVEQVLGTGDAESEEQWAEVLKEVEHEEVLFQSKKKRKALRQAAAVEAMKQVPGPQESNVAESDLGKARVESFDGVKFY